jgi:hypothetical protein
MKLSVRCCARDEAERALLRNPGGCERFRAVEVALRAPLGSGEEFRAVSVQRQPHSCGLLPPWQRVRA